MFTADYKIDRYSGAASRSNSIQDGTNGTSTPDAKVTYEPPSLVGAAVAKVEEKVEEKVDAKIEEVKEKAAKLIAEAN